MDITSQKALEHFASLGQRLKSVREEKGLSLAEVAANTRISQIYLQALESGEPKPLPALTFVRGFVRNYAIALGLDEHEILEEFRRFAQLEERREMPLEPPAEVDMPRMLTVPMPKLLLGVVLVGLIVWAGYLIVRVATSPDALPPAVAEQSESGDQPAGEPSGGEPVTPTALPGATPPLSSPAFPPTQVQPPPPPPPQPPPVQPPRNLRLRVRGLERTWIRLSVDRREPRDVLLEPAETVEYEANEEFRLTVGKSHGVSVYLNDEEILLPEEPNLLVRDVILNKVTLFKLEN